MYRAVAKRKEIKNSCDTIYSEPDGRRQVGTKYSTVNSPGDIICRISITNIAMIEDIIPTNKHITTTCPFFITFILSLA